MQPKLMAKSQAIGRGYSPTELFRVRATHAQIGWLETSLAAEAAQAICGIERALREGAGGTDVFVHRKLLTFEAWEAGLLGTWETPSEMICVPRFA